MASQTMERLLALKPKLTAEEVAFLQRAARRKAEDAAEEMLGRVEFGNDRKEVRYSRQCRREWSALADELENLYAKLTTPKRKARR